MEMVQPALAALLGVPVAQAGGHHGPLDGGADELLVIHERAQGLVLLLCPGAPVEVVLDGHLRPRSGRLDLRGRLVLWLPRLWPFEGDRRLPVTCSWRARLFSSKRDQQAPESRHVNRSAEAARRGACWGCGLRAEGRANAVRQRVRVAPIAAQSRPVRGDTGGAPNTLDSGYHN